MKTLTFVSIALITAFTSLPAFAADNNIVVDGNFKGANCMYFKQSCPDVIPQARIELEPDFVIAQPNGTYYYVNNIDKFTKEKYLGNNIRIIGALTGKDHDTIRAAKLEVKKGGQYHTAWTEKDSELARRLENEHNR